MQAVCVINSVKGKKIYGEIKFTETPSKKSTRINGIIRGLKPGKHGIHIHESGNLTKGCDGLCAHYNPYGKNHGGPKSKDRHVGDLGNLLANSDGVARINILDKEVKLTGKYSVIGRSIIVHADKDDLGLGDHHDSLTTGHSGKRIACGIIGIL